MSDIVIYTDGGSRNNPGPAGIGVVVYENERKIGEVSDFIGIQTNNWAEYEAVIRAFAKAKELGLRNRNIEIRLDSELVKKQLTGEYQVKEETLWPQFMKVHNLLVKDFTHTRFTHVLREQNKEADALANEAMDRGQ